MSDKAKGWLIIIGILLVLGAIFGSHSGSGSGSPPAPGSCEALWQANKNDPNLPAFTETHSQYIANCKQDQQWLQDHFGTTTLP